MSFSEAFASARAEIGAGGIFEWHGNSYNTYTKEEFESMTGEEQGNYAESIEGQIVSVEETTEVEIYSQNSSLEAGFIDSNNDGIIDGIMSEVDENGEVHMLIDTDGDGVLDTNFHNVNLDTMEAESLEQLNFMEGVVDGDIVAGQLVDSNNDGVIDSIGADLNNDGFVDIGSDFDNDGEIDEIVYDVNNQDSGIEIDADDDFFVNNEDFSSDDTFAYDSDIDTDDFSDLDSSYDIDNDVDMTDFV